LYYPLGNIIQLMDLTTEAIRQISVEGSNRFALITDERIILVDKKNKVKVWEIPVIPID
jgi:hypothetical protein